jgi:hypothetical protein
MSRSLAARVRALTTGTLSAFVLVACAVAPQEAGAPSEGVSPSTQDDATSATNPSPPDRGDEAVADEASTPDANAARRAQLEACAARFEAETANIDGELRAAGFDPAVVHAESESIRALEGQARATALDAFRARYGAVGAKSEARLRLGETGADKALPDVSTLETATLRPPALTSCLPVIRQGSPFNFRRTSGGGVSTTLTNGFRATASGGAANQQTNTATIGHIFSNLSPDEQRVTAFARVRITSGHVEGWSALFGYANAGASLNMRVVENGNVVCSSPEVKLSELHINTGSSSSDIGPIVRLLSCSYPRARNRGALRVEVQLGAWIGVGGVAGASAAVQGVVEAIDVARCVEPRVITGVQGLCIEPLFVLPNGRPQPLSPVRVAECSGALAQRWTRTSFGQLRSDADATLCIARGSGDAVELARCSSTDPSHRWTGPADGTIRDNTATMCLDATWPSGGPSGDFNGSLLHSFRCNSGSAVNQTWRIHPR